jgi:hypothetical protein
MAEYTSPESRFRMPSLFEGIGRKMGEMLLSGSRFGEKKQKVHTDAVPYDLFSSYEPEKAYIKSAETELTKSLFRIPNKVTPESVFDMIEEDGRKVFNISESESGKKYQERLDKFFGNKFKLFAEAYNDMLKEGDSEGAEKMLAKAKEKFISTNPDTGEPSFKFREGVLGDVHLNPKGEFNDYWNIGLDEGESMTSATNLKRALAAPFTKPPTVRGAVNLDEKNRRFYESLFPNEIEDKIIKKMLAGEQSYFQ